MQNTTDHLAQHATTTSSLSVWVIDDHPITRLACEIVLGRCELNLCCRDFDSPASALKAMSNQTPDIIILDLMFPLSSGYDILKIISRDYPNIKVIVYTAKDEAQYAEHCIKSGAHGFVTKGAPSNELIRAVRAVSAGGSHIACPPKQNDTGSAITPDGLADLSTRETEVLQLIGLGLDTRTIAKRLYRSPKTIETYRYRIKKKLGLTNQIQLSQVAWQFSYQQ